MGIPESLGGVGTERSAVTNALIAEALAHGDMGLAVACLAPSAVSTALVLWGTAEQQATYLGAFAAETPPPAALAVRARSLKPGRVRLRITGDDRAVVVRRGGPNGPIVARGRVVDGVLIVRLRDQPRGERRYRVTGSGLTRVVWVKVR